MNYRHEARQALKRARKALETNDDEQLKYAALELRMAMESLTYDRAKAYKNEFPPDEYETWQPRKVMAVLLEIDATADKDSTLSYGIEETPGQPASQMTMLGTETVLNMEKLRRHYDALGSFLHVPTLKQTRSGKGHDREKLRARCTEIAEYIEKVLASPERWSRNFGPVDKLWLVDEGPKRRWQNTSAIQLSSRPRLPLKRSGKN